MRTYHIACLMAVSMIILVATSCKSDTKEREEHQVQKPEKEFPERMLIPEIDGEWTTIATKPQLGALATSHMQPVDFAIWQAADGTWQIWSCIRYTKEEGNTRVFHRWEGKSLEDPKWEAKGVSFRADTSLGEAAGGMQAPYVIKENGTYYMFYGDWNRICLAQSTDGKTFERVLREGSPALFGNSNETNTRDAMVIRKDSLWYCYYTAHPNSVGKVYVRTSDDMIKWSNSSIVATGGYMGNTFANSECPFVVQHENGWNYLFRTQEYGYKSPATPGGHMPLTTVYVSDDLKTFGKNDDSHLATVLNVAAPEIFQHEGQWYIAALTEELDGIRLANLKWTEKKKPDLNDVENLKKSLNTAIQFNGEYLTDKKNAIKTTVNLTINNHSEAGNANQAIHWINTEGWDIEPKEGALLLDAGQSQDFEFVVNNDKVMQAAPILTATLPWADGHTYTFSKSLPVKRVIYAKYIDVTKNENFKKENINKLGTAHLLMQDPYYSQPGKTKVWVWYNDDMICFVYECRDNDLQGLRNTVNGQDNNVSRDDNVGFMIMPDTAKEEAVFKYLNNKGSSWDALLSWDMNGRMTTLTKWNKSLQLGTKTTPNSWEVQLYYLWDDVVKKPSPGDVWRINLFRRGPNNSERQAFMLPLSYDPDSYGYLIFE